MAAFVLKLEGHFNPDTDDPFIGADEVPESELFKALAAAASVETRRMMETYARNVNLVQKLRENSELRVGRINSSKSEVLRLTKVGAILNDLSFVHINGRGMNDLRMLNASATFPPNKQISVNLADTVSPSVLKRIADSKKKSLYYMMWSDSIVESLLKELVPLIDRGHILVEPTRHLLYEIERLDENGKHFHDSIPVSIDSPLDEWNIFHSGEAEFNGTADEGSFGESKLLSEVLIPYVDGISVSDLGKLLEDEKDILVEFRFSIRALIRQVKDNETRSIEIQNDVVRPKIANMERRFHKIANMNRLKIGGAVVSTATMGLLSYATTGLAAGITAVAGASGLVYLTKEIAGGISDLSSLKDDPSSYLLWKLKRWKEDKPPDGN